MNKLHITIVIETKINVGGAFNQSLNHIQMFNILNKDNFEISVFTTIKDNVKELNKININVNYIKTTYLDYFIAYCATNILLRRIQFKLKLISNFEKKLIKNKSKLVYFLSPGSRCLMLQKTNYIINLWDLCHKDYLIFPENRNFNKFIELDFIYKNTLPQALLIITDSEKLSYKVNKFYSVNFSQLLSIPYTQSPLINNSVINDSILMKYGLNKKEYFFYPAQFWSHKNHIRILEALEILKNKNKEFKVVFTGYDHGNLKYVLNYIKDHNLSENVKYLGFVESNEIATLYSNSIALLMPTYYGPTNIPPLEAWNLDVPVIYNIEFKEQTKSGAIYIDPDSSLSISNAMLEIYENRDLQLELIKCGKIEYNLLNINYKKQFEKLEKILNEFRIRFNNYE
jgi:glycosyltransferase involved in cell wall biosynthesis